MIQMDAVEKRKHKKLMVVWCITFLTIFPLLIVLGLLMRSNQGEIIKISTGAFYALMTLHGLGMASTLFTISLAALAYLIGTRYTRISVTVGYYVYFLFLIGMAALTVACLVGEFGAGWYILYPLPFIGINWKTWSIALSIISLIVLGVAWLIGCLHVLYSISKEYGGFGKIMGWQYLRKKQPDKELPPIALITTVSLVPGVIAYIVGAIMLIMYLLQYFEPGISYNVLLIKNMDFFFGHTLVNITLYCCTGWLYTLLPEFTHREWKLNKVTVYAWNATFLFIIFAYFHHLYMDFSQPEVLQYIGEIVSYSSAVPATAVTLFGVIAQFYHSRTKLTMVPILFLLGAMGWAIGGFAAVVDSTIAINKVFHNTLWVDAHFHSYLLGGVVLFIFAFLYYLGCAKEDPEKDVKPNLGFWLFLLGIWGFLLMFYLGGLNSIPRRYSTYGGVGIDSFHSIGVLLAQIAVVSIYVLLLGLLIMYVTLFSKFFNMTKPSYVVLSAKGAEEE